jgi:hypothetical protein
MRAVLAAVAFFTVIAIGAPADAERRWQTGTWA